MTSGLQATLRQPTKDWPGAGRTLTATDFEQWNITGTANDDRITGSKGNDTLIGGGGKDSLSGGSGGDLFVYKSIIDSRAGTSECDIITDFSGNSGDRIDMRSIDAFTTKAGKQGFTYIGSSRFSGVAGEIRFQAGLLQANINGDVRADFELELVDVQTFKREFLIL